MKTKEEKKIIFKIFIKFLKKEGVYRQYLKALKTGQVYRKYNVKTYTDPKYFLAYNLDKPMRLISDAFAWAEQSDVKWIVIHQKWLLLLKNCSFRRY